MFELLGSEEILLFTSSSTASLLTFILLNTWFKIELLSASKAQKI